MTDISLTWLEKEGRGYLSRLDQEDYGQDYFDIYAGYEINGFALRLNRKRAELVDRYIQDAPLVDVGIGSGTFIKVRANTVGYDVGGPSIEWLKARDKYFDVTTWPCLHASFWDSLEHMRRPESVVGNVQNFAFVSIPIFRDAEHVRESKHFQPEQHWHYFTPWGFVRWMSEQGFELLEFTRLEEHLGREDIGTFVFKRSP